MKHPMEYVEEADAKPRQWEKLDDIKDQSHADLLKRYANLSQENLRLKMELAEKTCAVISLQSLLNVHMKDISAALEKTGGAFPKPVGDA